MKVFYLFRGFRGYNRAMLRIQEIGDHPQREEIERRLKAIWMLDRLRPAAAGGHAGVEPVPADRNGARFAPPQGVTRRCRRRLREIYKRAELWYLDGGRRTRRGRKS